MGHFKKRASLLFASTAVLTGYFPSVLWAQTADGGIQEVVVTATKSSQALSKVPLSITAVTQKDLDRQDIRNIQDLTRIVPSLNLQQGSTADRVPYIAIRGIASSNGAATTGIYLDDTPLQKRNAIGLSGSGSPIPLLFDLERVEVLRGPQGTLYGGSSEGGTVRFITPAPSLTTYSGYGRADVSTTQDGAPSGEVGVAVGGPIVQDKLGFRASFFNRHVGGYIDQVDRLTGKTVASDTNSENAYAGRVALAFAPTSRLLITPAIYVSQDRYADTDAYWENIPSYAAPEAGNVPAHTYGPYNFYGPYKSGNTCAVGDNYVGVTPTCASKQPRTTKLFVPSLTVAYDFGAVSAKSVTSYIHDETNGIADYSNQEEANFQGGSPFLFTLPLYSSHPQYMNKRYGITEELRFNSKPNDGKLEWVGGVYYAAYNNHAYYYIPSNLDALTGAAFGGTVEEIFGNPMIDGNVEYFRNQELKETELAGFGQGTYKLTSRLSVIGGLRVSRTDFTYHQVTAGPLAGFDVATTANGGLTNGEQRETPVTPKLGVQYQMDRDTQFYATASEGYRIGGVNQPPPQARCGSDLSSLGITSTPSTYGSDSLWSYEGGAKARFLGGKAQISASAFYIDWSDVQVNVALPTCGFGYVVNGGKAVSKGFDLQTEVIVLPGLTATLQAGYTQANYIDTVSDSSNTTMYVRKGDPLPTPKWTYALGLQYDFKVMGEHSAYLRGDYQFTGPYQSGTGAGTASYAPDTNKVGSSNFVSARLGTLIKGVDISLYVDNLLNSQDVLSRGFGGRTGCETASCSSYSSYNPLFLDTTFRPRTVGLTVTYRY